MLCVRVAGILVGVVTYDGMETKTWVFIILDAFILYTFTLESVLKIFGYCPSHRQLTIEGCSLDTVQPYRIQYDSTRWTLSLEILM